MKESGDHGDLSAFDGDSEGGGGLSGFQGEPRAVPYVAWLHIGLYSYTCHRCVLVPSTRCSLGT